MECLWQLRNRLKTVVLVSLFDNAAYRTKFRSGEKDIEEDSYRLKKQIKDSYVKEKANVNFILNGGCNNG